MSCPNCRYFPVYSFLTPCGHRFCRPCSQLIARTPGAECPLCRKRVHWHRILSVPIRPKWIERIGVVPLRRNVGLGP